MNPSDPNTHYFVRPFEKMSNRDSCLKCGRAKVDHKLNHDEMARAVMEQKRARVTSCPVCGNEERHPGTGLLTCECPAPIRGRSNVTFLNIPSALNDTLRPFGYKLWEEAIGISMIPVLDENGNASGSYVLTIEPIERGKHEN